MTDPITVSTKRAATSSAGSEDITLTALKDGKSGFTYTHIADGCSEGKSASLIRNGKVAVQLSNDYACDGVIAPRAVTISDGKTSTTYGRGGDTVDAKNLDRIITAGLKASNRALGNGTVTAGESAQLETYYAKVAAALADHVLTNDETKDIIDSARVISPKAKGHRCTGKAQR